MRSTRCWATPTTTTASGSDAPLAGGWGLTAPRWRTTVPAALQQGRCMGEPQSVDALPRRARADFRTQRRDQAVESIERLYGPHTLELKSRGPLHMHLAS